METKSSLFIILLIVHNLTCYIGSLLMQVVNKLQGSGKSKRDGWRTEFPLAGLGGAVIDKMKDEKQKDVVWQGKCSGTVYV